MNDGYMIRPAVIINSKERRKTVDDKNIIRLFFNRDEDAIKEADAVYGARLKRISYGITGDRRDAEECVNDAYLSAWNSIPPSRPASLQAYLTALLRNAALDVIKKSKRARRIPKKLFKPLEELSEILPGGDAEDAITERELSGIINGYVRQLSDRQRYIFISRYYVNRSIGEISKKLGVSKSTVNKELAGIKQGLKERLEKEGYDI